MGLWPSETKSDQLLLQDGHCKFMCVFRGLVCGCCLQNFGRCISFIIGLLLTHAAQYRYVTIFSSSASVSFDSHDFSFLYSVGPSREQACTISLAASSDDFGCDQSQSFLINVVEALSTLR